MSWESKLQVRVIDGQFEERGKTYLLVGKHIDIGRLPRDYEPMEHEILFREPTLSRVHATLTWKSVKMCYVLEHKSDVNSTLVNGKNIKKMALISAGDRIQLGYLILELEEARQGDTHLSYNEARAETRRRLHAIVAEVEKEFSHVKLG